MGKSVYFIWVITMLKRKIEQYLYDWHRKDKKKALIIEGPRQVGKTTSIVDFINRHYEPEHIVYIDFSKQTQLISIFDTQIDAERIVQSIRIHYPNKQLVKGKSIIVFDNIQLAERAIVSLRSFTSYGDYDVIATGVYLGNLVKSMSAFPVGYVERFQLGSLDFEEFLWANGFEDDMVRLIKSNFELKEPLLEASHTIFMNLFREYMAIGGMPQVVSEYIKERDFQLAYSLLEDIVELYQTDILAHCKKRSGKKINDCLNSLPVQLYRDNKKFQFRSIKEGARSSIYEPSVEWLVDAGIVLQASNVDQPEKPLHSHVRDNVYKLYMHDPGLFVAMLGDEIQLEILRGGMDAYNGAMYETVIASMLYKLGQTLYYFEKNSKLHVDFLITLERELYAVEVKTADHPKSKILQSLQENYQVDYGIKLGSHNIEHTNKITTYPIYMAMFLERS